MLGYGDPRHGLCCSNGRGIFWMAGHDQRMLKLRLLQPVLLDQLRDGSNAVKKRRIDFQNQQGLRAVFRRRIEGDDQTARCRGAHALLAAELAPLFVPVFDFDFCTSATDWVNISWI